jgi:hypothetical protein
MERMRALPYHSPGVSSVCRTYTLPLCIRSPAKINSITLPKDIKRQKASQTRYYTHIQASAFRNSHAKLGCPLCAHSDRQGQEQRSVRGLRTNLPQRPDHAQILKVCIHHSRPAFFPSTFPLFLSPISACYCQETKRKKKITKKFV